MTVQHNTDHDNIYAVEYRWVDWVPGLDNHEPLTNERTFVRSNGTTLSRIYERLTKASRRIQNEFLSSLVDAEEVAYRRGVKDTLEAVREELI